MREILASRTGEAIAVTARPELTNRSIPAVEELWESASHRCAVEHTRLESYGGQIENEAKRGWYAGCPNRPLAMFAER